MALGVAVDRPMNAQNYVQSLHIFALGNPWPEVADYFFSPLSGRAEIATRVRLNETQIVGAVARTSTGEVIVAELLDADRHHRMSHERRDLRHRQSDADSGPRAGTIDRRRSGRGDDDDQPSDGDGAAHQHGRRGHPANLVQRFLASFNRATIFEARFHRSVAVNPYLRFFIAPPRSGELVLRWEEDSGRASTERVALQVV